MSKYKCLLVCPECKFQVQATEYFISDVINRELYNCEVYFVCSECEREFTFQQALKFEKIVPEPGV